MNKYTLLIFALAILVASCSSNNSDEKKQPDFLAKNIDSTINPADDFFAYAEGNWLKSTPIPAEESSWGIGNLVQEEIYNRLRKINEDASSKSSTKGIEQKIGDFWYSGMDTLSLEKQGMKPLKAHFDQIDGIRSTNDLINVSADFHNKGIDVLFNDYVAQDDKNSEIYAYQMSQGGLGMPNRGLLF
ncbi:MAG: hypothetical protein ACR2KZ_13675 [Segetibacter sp.]